MTYNEKIVDTISNTETIRPYTEKEILLVEKEIEKNKLEAEQLKVKEAKRQALLDKLGITEEEAKLLLG